MMDSQKVEKCPFLSFRRIPDRGPGQAPESRKTKSFWTPATLSRRKPGAGVTAWRTSYKAINYAALLKCIMGKRDSGFRLAPPTRAPSMSGFDMRSRTLSGLTLPP
jgi:hypothetical protein